MHSVYVNMYLVQHEIRFLHLFQTEDASEEKEG